MALVSSRAAENRREKSSIEREADNWWSAYVSEDIKGIKKTTQVAKEVEAMVSASVDYRLVNTGV